MLQLYFTVVCLFSVQQKGQASRKKPQTLYFRKTSKGKKKKKGKNLHIKKNILLSQFKYLKYLFMSES